MNNTKSQTGRSLQPIVRGRWLVKKSYGWRCKWRYDSSWKKKVDAERHAKCLLADGWPRVQITPPCKPPNNEVCESAPKPTS